MEFQQAVIKVEKEKEFGDLKAAIERVFARPHAEKFLEKLSGWKLSVRNFEAVLDHGFIEHCDPELSKSRVTARSLYQALTVSDQALMREFYLETLEKVDDKARRKYHKAYTTY